MYERASVREEEVGTEVWSGGPPPKKKGKKENIRLFLRYGIERNRRFVNSHQFFDFLYKTTRVES